MGRIFGIRRALRIDRGAPDVDRSVDEELAFHFDMTVRDLMANGMTPEDARVEAERRFGDVQGARERIAAIDRTRIGRERRAASLDALWQDIRYAARGLWKKPAFTAAVVGTLALGIGANAAMFSVVDQLLFRPPPLMRNAAATHRVYFMQTFRDKESASASLGYARYTDIVSSTRSFARTAGFAGRKMAVGTGDAAREMQVAVVSASYFEFFDAPPALGRYFVAAEDVPTAPTPVAVLSAALWRTQYGARRDVLGQQLQIGPVVYTIIGVAAPGFVGVSAIEPPVAFIPITRHGSAQGATLNFTDGTWNTTYQWTWMRMIVERKPGVSVEAASADLSSAFRRSYQAQIDKGSKIPPAALVHPRAIAASILSERGPNPSSLSKVATWVSGVAFIVLLIACANVANLLLGRALRRRREIAVRLALGVGRGRLLSQLLTESVLLAVLGGVAGIVVAQWGGAALRAAFADGAAVSGVAGDGRTLLFVGAAALLAGLTTGLAPLAQTWRTDVTGGLRAGAREGTYQHSTLRFALLVMQGALSVVLLVGAGLFVRSLHNVRSLRLGYDVQPVVIAEMNMRGVKLDSVSTIALRHRLLEEAKAIPGVENAALRNTIPFWSTWSGALFVTGIDSVSALGEFDLNAVSTEYFATSGTRILRGRGISDLDTEHAPGAMVVSESMAKRLWPTGNALGQCVRVSADTMPCSYVVGVSENVRSNELSDNPEYYYFLSAAQFHPDVGGLSVRVRGDGAGHADEIRRRLQRLMPGASYVTVTPFADVIGHEMSSWKLGATMFVTFGALALTLAAIGLYSVIAYNVAQRTHELGVRIALGAQLRDIVRLVVREGLLVGVVGVALGGLLALLAARWVKPLLFNESPRDPAVYAIVIIVLLGAALSASLIPALRASKVDPNVALRSD